MSLTHLVPEIISSTEKDSGHCVEIFFSSSDRWNETDIIWCGFGPSHEPPDIKINKNKK